ncbi:FliH/SctL family protein [Niveibacterium sp. COAC-50]|uniref:FliH/SctL family protein n=1 Tax=Niveibacterium sp. COAC-50 TaxID=2729384 RepID=UPI0015519E35|nr:FliH/SctL family protein [Niveibacterium sp. COAC-50]
MESIVRAAAVSGARKRLRPETVAPVASATPEPPQFDETALRAALESKLRVEFKREADALYESERQRGYAEGLASGNEEFRRLAAERAERDHSERTALLRDTLARIDASLSDRLRLQEAQIVELVTIAATRILGETFVDAEAVAAVVRHTLAAAHAAGRVRVRLHPDDLTRLTELIDPQELATASQQLEFAADAGLAGGGCIIDTPIGQFDASLDTQLRVLHETLAAARRGARNDT